MDQTAKDQVLSEIAALEQQVAIYTAEVDAITSTDPLDQVKHAAIKAELDTATGKLEAKRAELATIEDAGQAAQEELMTSFEALDVGGGVKVRVRDLAADELTYQMLLIGLMTKFSDQAQKNAQIVAALKSSYESQIEELEDGLSEISKLRDENYRLSDKCADLEAKRDAAALVNDEQTAEIARLKADNDNLRKQMETSTKPAETNLTFNAEAAKEAFLASRPAVYNKREYDRSNWVANLLENDEEVIWPKIYNGKYREVTTAEAESFRAEQAEQAQSSETDAVSDNPLGDSDVLSPPVIEFPTTVPGEFQGASADNAVVFTPEETTRRIRAIEKRLDELEGIESSVA